MKSKTEKHGKFTHDVYRGRKLTHDGTKAISILLLDFSKPIQISEVK